MFETRKSIRKYLPQEPDRALILQILEAGRVAPSAKNRQPWKYLVYSGSAKEKLLQAMAEGIERQQKNPFLPKKFKKLIASARNTLRIMREAPIIIMVLNENSDDPYGLACYGKRINEILDTLSIGASVENMLLKATELGIGSLWIGNTVFAHRQLAKALGTRCQIAGAVALGYSNEQPKGRPRKTLEDIVEFRSE